MASRPLAIGLWAAGALAAALLAAATGCGEDGRDRSASPAQAGAGTPAVASGLSPALTARLVGLGALADRLGAAPPALSTRRDDQPPAGSTPASGCVGFAAELRDAGAAIAAPLASPSSPTPSADAVAQAAAAAAAAATAMAPRIPTEPDRRQPAAELVAGLDDLGRALAAAGRQGDASTTAALAARLDNAIANLEQSATDLAARCAD